MDMMGLEPGFRTLKQSRAHLLKYLPASQDELPPRSVQVSQSYMILCLPVISTKKQINFLIK